MMYIFTYCILMMDLVSGLCHYCTMGLPPEKLFSIHSNWMPWLKPSITVVAGGLCSACEVVSINTIQCQDRGSCMEAAGYLLCGNPFTWALCVSAGVTACLALMRLCFVHIYMTPYNISAYFIGQQDTGVLPEWDNPCILHTDINNTLRPFIQGTYPRVSFSAL